MVTKEQIEKIASLCKLRYSEEEIDQFAEDFTQLLEYMDKLNEINTDGLEALYSVNDHTQRLREDIVGESLEREELVKNTREEQFGYFKILRIVE
ncbi:MAG: Asp-tRNA(Asn)/Glu-tRNA(Gln) amidotransferase subunit GatC [Tissierellaceae bacterium]